MNCEYLFFFLYIIFALIFTRYLISITYYFITALYQLSNSRIQKKKNNRLSTFKSRNKSETAASFGWSSNN